MRVSGEIWTRVSKTGYHNKAPPWQTQISEHDVSHSFTSCSSKFCYHICWSSRLLLLSSTFQFVLFSRSIHPDISVPQINFHAFWYKIWISSSSKFIFNKWYFFLQQICKGNIEWFVLIYSVSCYETKELTREHKSCT